MNIEFMYRQSSGGNIIWTIYRDSVSLCAIMQGILPKANHELLDCDNPYWIQKGR